MKTLLLTIIYMVCSASLIVQDKTTYTQTEATIIELDSKVSGRRLSAMATVNYKTKTGEEITSKVRLLYVPFLGTFKEVGETIDIEYETENPYIVKSKVDSFLTKYGLYFLIGIGLIISFKTFRKNMKSGNQKLEQ